MLPPTEVPEGRGLAAWNPSAVSSRSCPNKNPNRLLQARGQPDHRLWNLAFGGSVLRPRRDDRRWPRIVLRRHWSISLDWRCAAWRSLSLGTRHHSANLGRFQQSVGVLPACEGQLFDPGLGSPELTQRHRGGGRRAVRRARSTGIPDSLPRPNRHLRSGGRFRVLTWCVFLHHLAADDSTSPLWSDSCCDELYGPMSLRLRREATNFDFGIFEDGLAPDEVIRNPKARTESHAESTHRCQHRRCTHFRKHWRSSLDMPLRWNHRGERVEQTQGVTRLAFRKAKF